MTDGSTIRQALDCDLDPAGVLLRLRADSHPFALTGAWANGGAILGSDPIRTCTPPQPHTAVFGENHRQSGDGWYGGWVGYLGYDGRTPRRLPLWWFGYYDHVLRWDGRGWWFEAFVTAGREEAIEERFQTLNRRLARPAEPTPYACGEFGVIPAPAEHRAAVARAIELIRRGDIFQANICLRLEAGFEGDPLDLFCAGIRAVAPPYAAFLNPPDGAIASFSPELFLKLTPDGTVVTSPIKGTSDDPRELERSVKDRAENVMIVDLMRNDLGRVCESGSVTVTRMNGLEQHPGLWHLVSDVTGQLREDCEGADLIEAAFPPGSVTGAPKVRALEVIGELEAAPREVYTGAIGYRSVTGTLELNVAIRSFEFRAGRVWFGAGGGITAASDPDAEYSECLLKAAPLIKAIGGTLGSPRPHPDARFAELRPRSALGVFTSLRVRDGSAPGLSAHLTRLEQSVRALYGKELPPTLAGDVAAVLAGSTTNGRLRITARPLAGQCAVSVRVVPTGPDPGLLTLRPVTVPGGLGAHKWADRRLLESLVEAAAGEMPLLVDTDGCVLETDRANVFAVVDGTLRTPEADGRILPGVTRASVLSAAREAGIAVVEGRLTLEDLAAASEVFVTNSVFGLMAVGSQRGTLAQRIADLVTPPAGTRPAEARRPAKRPAVRGGGVLIIDNYDSFTYNLVHLFRRLGAAVEVVRNDEVSADDVANANPAGIVISPGPCSPAEAGVSLEVVRHLAARIPVLGVCLGHQVIAAAYGASIVSTAPMHGRASAITHDGKGLLAGLPNPFEAARYHSLIVDERDLPEALQISARTDGLIMGVRHRVHRAEGVQFHPESVLTSAGELLAANFMQACREPLTRPRRS